MENSQSVPAVCWAVIDCGIQTWTVSIGQHDPDDPTYYRPRQVRELRIGFELADEHDRNGRKRVLTRWYARSFNKRSSLYRDLCSWLDVQHLEHVMRDDRGRFDFAELVTRGARLEVAATEEGFRRIVGIHPGPALYCTDRDPILFELDRFDVETFHRLPEPIRARVTNSPTFLAMHGEPNPPIDAIAPRATSLTDEEIPW